MKNLRLNYRYRDAHNYKEFGSVVFANLTGISVEAACRTIRWFVTQTTAERPLRYSGES